MKKAIVYIIAVLIALNALAGCGMSADRNTATASPTPMVTTPDVNNGIVNDNDGIITDRDNGRVGASATPGNNGATGTDDANGSMNDRTGAENDMGGEPGTGTGARTSGNPSATPSATAKATEKP